MEKADLMEQIESPEIVLVPGIYDGITAKVVESLGFKMAMIGGGAVTNAISGMPDYGFLNLTDMEQHVRRLSKAVDLGIIVDADTGYGNAVHVSNAVESLENAGASMIMIEDQVFPKRCGHFAGKSVVSTKEMVRKVEAAVDARADSETLLIARTDAAAPLGVDEATSRLDAYAEHGADIVIADALLSEGDIRRVSDEVAAPVMVNMGFGLVERPTTPLISPRVLEDIGVEIVCYGRLTRSAAVMGMQNALTALLSQRDERAVDSRPDLIVDQDEYTELLGLPELREREERYSADPT